MFHSISKTRALCRSSFHYVPKSRNSTMAKTSKNPELWRITAAVAVERLPSLTPALTPLEEKMKKLLDTIEYEQSKKSDHEVRHEEDEMYAEMKKRGEPIPVERANIITAYDDEDRWKRDVDKFKPATKVTIADENDDKTSLDRSLDHSLFLVLKNNNSWTLPIAHNEKGESLRDSAERALALQDISAQVIGNAPFIHYKNIYSKKYQESSGKIGEHVFVYKAFVQANGENKPKESHIWLRKSELEDLAGDNVGPLKKTLLNIIYNPIE